MRIRAPLLVLGATLLAGCVAAPAPDDPGLLRNPTVPLSVISRGGADAMQGEWKVRAASPGYRDVTTVTFNTAARPRHMIAFEEITCPTVGVCETLTDGWLAQPLAQNRWRLSSETADSEMELWVIWIDDDLRTAAIGSPDSDMVFILDRKDTGGTDRITAAREVLEFNGYNIAALQMR